MCKCINPLSLPYPKPWDGHVLGVLHELHLFLVDSDAAFTANCTSRVSSQCSLLLPLVPAALGEDLFLNSHSWHLCHHFCRMPPWEGQFLMEKPFPPQRAKGTSPASRWVPHVWEPGVRKWEPLGIQGHPLVPQGKSCWREGEPNRAQQGPRQSQDKRPGAGGAGWQLQERSPRSCSALPLSQPCGSLKGCLH